MSELTYNSVPLNFLSTNGPEFDPVYDDSGTDYLCTRIIIICRAVITAGVAPALPGEEPAETVARISHLLNTPRRGLVYTVGGKQLVRVVAANGNTAVPLRDAKNGPITQANVTRIMGTGSIVVSFRVETYVVDCPEATQPPQYVGHRWTETAEINEFAMSKRTRVGTVIVRSDLLSNADQLRGIVVPPIETDWRRLSSRYTLAASGLRLDYEYTDEEAYLAPPAPAAKAEGHFSITCKDGASYYAECFLRLQGAKPTDKSILMRRACAIALAKIQLAGPAGGAGSFPVYGTMAEDMFGNDVSVRLTAQVQPARGRMTTQGGFWDGVVTSIPGGQTVSGVGRRVGQALASRPATRPDGTEPGISMPNALDWLQVPQVFMSGDGQFNPGSRGSAALGLVASYLQDPCLRILATPQSQQAENTSGPTGQVPPAEISIHAATADDQHSFRAGDYDGSGVYDIYEVSIRDFKNLHTFSLPVGKKDADAAVITTAAPAVRRRAEWRAVRIGSKPRVPDPQLTDTNWTLTNAETLVDKVEPTADGSQLRFEVAGLYEYVGKKGGGMAVTLTASPVPPWVDPTAGDPASKAYEFVKNILEPGQSSLSTGGGGIIPGVNG